MATPRVHINPGLITWARTTAGFEPADLADKLDVEASVLSQWESGTSAPRLTQLEAIAQHCKRPLAALLLPEPPPEPQHLPDFRILAEPQASALSPEARFAIRRARWLRSAILDLYHEAGLTTEAHLPQVDPKGDLQGGALAIREWLGITTECQFRWEDSSEALKGWRAALHSRNVLVLQMKMDMKEMRAFSLAFRDLPVIVVNISDASNGRIFSIFHELGHVIRQTGGICLGERSLLERHPSPEERLCNRFAGEVLVPTGSVELDEPRPPFDELASRFKVSRYVVLYRALDLGATPREQFQQLIAGWLAEDRQAAEQERRRQEARDRKGGASGAQRALWELGPDLASLVIAAESSGLMTSGEAAECLNVKARELDKVAHLLAGV